MTPMPGADGLADPSPATSELGFLDAGQLASLIERGELTSAELVANFRRRAEEVDRRGPGLRSLLAQDPRAEEVAAELDAEAATGGRRSRLHGIPVVVKDSIDSAGLATTAGSLALAEAAPPDRDAPVVARLRAAGAVVVAKANLSEWSYFRGKGAVSGWSAVGGQTRNPHVLDRSPGGSSSGSGAAIAAGIAPLALGEETAGSIVCPAAFCGVVGLKPTVGLVPRTGVVPISASQDSVGPMTRTVADAAILLSVMAGPDPEDPVSAEAPVGVDYLEAIAGVGAGTGLAGVRLGVPRNSFGDLSPRAEAVIETAFSALRDAGADLVDPANIPTARAIARWDDDLTVFLHEMKAGMVAYLARRPSPVPRSLEDLIAFNDAHAAEELALFGQEHFIDSAAASGLEDPVYLRTRDENRRLARGGLEAVLGGWRLDALVSPTMDLATHIDRVGDRFAGGGGAYSVAAVAGYPVISVPAGEVDGLPVGLSFVGGAWSEATLLRLAQVVEQAVGVGTAPRFRPSIDIPLPA